jgi:hypothetical protein
MQVSKTSDSQSQVPDLHSSGLWKSNMTLKKREREKKQEEEEDRKKTSTQVPKYKYAQNELSTARTCLLL